MVIKAGMINPLDVHEKPAEPTINDPDGKDANNGAGNNTPSTDNDEAYWKAVEADIDKYQETIETKKCYCMISHIILIAACLVLVGLIIRAFVCDCENITNNNHASILFFGLFVLLLLTAGGLVYHFMRSNNKYDSVLNRLEILKTRIGLKKDKSTYLTDIDRELQLVARILESSNEQTPK